MIRLKRKDSERGQSFTEMAISMVFILILLAGIVDVGRMFFIFVAIRDAAQEGAAYGSFCPGDVVGIDARVRSASSNPVDLTDTTNILTFINRDCANPANADSCVVGDSIEVIVRAENYQMTMPFLGGVTIPLEARVSDTILTNLAKTSRGCPPQ